MHLFILCPPASGSTLLWRVLQTSPHVSALPGEGQGLVPNELFTADRWNPNKTIDWASVQEAWEKHWRPEAPVRLEKSPPHLVRAQQLAEHFPDSRFIIMVRDPYAFAEGVRRRWQPHSPYHAIARFWLACARFQMENSRSLAAAITVTYEELTGDPTGVCRRIIDLVPELERLDSDGEFAVFEKKLPLTNLNERQVATLGAADIFEINEALAMAGDVLAHFSYRLRPATPPPRWPALRRLLLHARAHQQRLGPDRWAR